MDASAIFPDGTPIDGVRGLRAFLLSHRDSYVAHVHVEAADLRARPSTSTTATSRRSGGSCVRPRSPTTAGRLSSSASSRARRSRLSGEAARMRGADRDRVMMITKKASRGAPCFEAWARASPLPLLDAMVPAMTALAQTAARPVTAFRRGLRAQRRHSWPVVSDRRGRRVRVHTDTEAARARFASACSSSAASTACRRRRRASGSTTTTPTPARASSPT